MNDRRSRVAPTAVWLLAALATPASADEAYRAEVRQWREAREARLQAEDGWLTVAGLFWLKEGDNAVGTDPSSEIVLPAGSAAARAGVLAFEGGRTVLRLAHGVEGRIAGEPVTGPRVLRSDEDGPADVVDLGRLSLYVIRRGDRYAVRLKDKENPERRGFKGLRWYDVKETHRIEARWVEHPQPRSLRVPNVLGGSTMMPSPGYAEFSLEGRTVRLEGVLEDPSSPELFFVFRDRTSGRETYGAGRFLYADPPREGRVVLDFNKAYNPPCAFTAYATCPLPPRPNWLPVRVEAGEMAYDSSTH